MAKYLPKLSERTDRLRKSLKKNEQWKWGPEQETDFTRIKQMLTEGPCLAHYAKKDNIVTTDASTTGLEITRWQKQDDGNTKPIAVVWGLEKFRFYIYGKKVHRYTEPLIKRNRSNKQYSARLTRWLDRLTHFDISIQHIAGSTLKFTDYLSRNPVRGAIPEENYDEEYVINILTEQAELNLKYGQLFANQSESSKTKVETENGTSEEQNEIIDNQSHSNRTFEKDYGVNKIQQSENNTSGQSDISTQSSGCLPKENLKFAQNKIKQTYIRNLPKWTETISITGALHVRSWR